MSPADWEAWLASRLASPVEVRFGRSRTMPLQVEQGPGPTRVRMHRFFLTAPEDVRESLARWIQVGRRARRACALLDGWIDARLAELPPREHGALSPCGGTHDLSPLAASLFADEFALDFETRPRPAVTWGRRARSRARRSLMLGSYQPASNLVRVHPVLDRAAVPDWFVRFVLFHEILHAALPARGRHHSPEFRARERGYRDYRRARAWERQHIDRLIRAARRGPDGRRPRQRLLF